jgi:hypothetical protein
MLFSAMSFFWFNALNAVDLQLESLEIVGLSNVCAYRLNVIGETKNIIYKKYFFVDSTIMS